MSTRTPSFWEDERLTMERSIALTIESLQAYGSLYKHWAVAYSGGKDSTATVTLVSSCHSGPTSRHSCASNHPIARARLEHAFAEAQREKQLPMFEAEPVVSAEAPQWTPSSLWQSQEGEVSART